MIAGRRPEQGIRSFVAVELPESMIPGILEAQKGLALQGVRMVKPELVHITLKFLGDITLAQLGAIKAALSRVRAEPFSARTSGLGAFPGRSVRVIWLGAEGDFSPLHRGVDDALSPLGFPREKGFRPHATLGRVGRPNPETSAILSERMSQMQLDLGEFTVDRFLLKKSTLTPGGPIYEDMAEYTL